MFHCIRCSWLTQRYAIYVYTIYMLTLCNVLSNQPIGKRTGEKEKFQWHGRMGYVHIDDVALCHILVYEHQNSHGRYLCSSTVVDNNELVSLLSTRYPLLPIPERYVAWIARCVCVCVCVESLICCLAFFLFLSAYIY